MKQITQFESSDGQRFDTLQQCEDQERFLKFREFLIENWYHGISYQEVAELIWNNRASIWEMVIDYNQ